MLTLKQINKALQEQYPKVEIVRGEGYFYLSSEDDATLNKISALYSSAIYVAAVNHLTLLQWTQRVQALFNDSMNRSGSYDNFEDR